MNNKNIIIAGAIALGVYLFSQGKSIFSAAAPQTTGQKIVQKVAQKRIGQPITRAAYIAAVRKAAAPQTTGQKIVQKVAQKRIGQPITRAAYIAAVRKAAARKAVVRKAAAQKIGKIIGKKVAQKVVPWMSVKTGGQTGKALVTYLQKQAKAMHTHVTQAANAVKNNSKIKLRSSKWAGGRTGMALVIYLKSREVAIAQALSQAKAAVPITKLFPGAEKSRVIPYKESSKHSYYGPKSHKLLNEGYGKNKAKRDKKQALEFRLNELRAQFPQSKL